MVGGEAGEPVELLGAAQVRVGLPASARKYARVRVPELASRLGQPLARRRAGSSPASGSARRRRLDEATCRPGRPARPRSVAAHRLDRVQRGAAGEHGEPPGQLPLVGPQQVPAPLDDRAQRPVPGRGRAVAARQQPEPVVAAGRRSPRRRTGAAGRRPARSRAAARRAPRRSRRRRRRWRVDREPGRGRRPPGRRTAVPRASSVPPAAASGSSVSPVSPSGSRLVASTATPGRRPAAGGRAPATSSTTCSQLSRTSSSVAGRARRPAAGPTGSVGRRRPASRTPSAARTACGTGAVVTGERSTKQASAVGRDRLDRQPGLAGAAGAEQGHQPGARGRAGEPVQLRRPGRRSWSSWPVARRVAGAGWSARRIARCDGGQLRRRVGAQLVGEQPPGLLEHGQRLGRPARGGERPHELAAQALAQRVRGDERAAARRRSVPPGAQVRVDPVLDGGQPQLVEPGRLVAPVGEVGQRRAAPQGERLPERGGGVGGVARRPGAPRPSAASRSKRWASTSSGSTASR